MKNIGKKRSVGVQEKQVGGAQDSKEAESPVVGTKVLNIRPLDKTKKKKDKDENQ